MEIILTSDIKGLGYANDIVSVKPGYARNYLIPKGMALYATASNRKRIEEEVRQKARKIAKIREEAQALADSIGELTLSIEAKAGESGKIFGSVTPIQIAEALNSKGFDIDRKKITIVENIKTLGEYNVVLDLHKEVKHNVSLNVVAAE